MLISKDEIKLLADKVRIELTEEEINSISESIIGITEKIEEIVDVDTSNEDNTFLNAKEDLDVKTEFYNEEIDQNVDMNKINNYDGKYLRVSKVDNE